MYSPDLLLEMFIREAGSSLRTVTSLHLHFENTCASTSAAATLDNVMIMLVSSTPSLESFTCGGHLSTEFLHGLGQACQRLSNLTLNPDSQDGAYLKSLMLQQPSLLPNITSLTFIDSTCRYELPDMSGCNSILQLNLQSFTFNTDQEWECLPRSLTHLMCADFGDGPPSCSDSSRWFASLESLVAEDEFWMSRMPIPVKVMIRLMRAAPALNFIQVGDETTNGTFVIKCDFDSSTYASTAADLREWHNMSASKQFTTAIYQLHCYCDSDNAAALAVIETLPCMTAFTSFELFAWEPCVLRALRTKIPNVQQLMLSEELDNTELLEIAACTSLERLNLRSPAQVSALGLLLLCQRLPKLSTILLKSTPQLEKSVLRGCEELLRGYGRVVSMEQTE